MRQGEMNRVLNGEVSKLRVEAAIWKQQMLNELISPSPKNQLKI
jgi:hypothetical protein